MSKDTLLKKEFSERDLQRARNIVNKDFTGGTKVGTGYEKEHSRHSEGDVWEENGKSWTIKGGLKQNVTKLDAAKKAIRIPLTCPKCGGSLNHWLAKKMYKFHGFCFDPCTVEYEAHLRNAGLYEQYEQGMMQGNMRQFVEDVENWYLSNINEDTTVVTEDGEVEDWKGNEKTKNNNMIKGVREYVEHLKTYIK